MQSHSEHEMDMLNARANNGYFGPPRVYSGSTASSFTWQHFQAAAFCFSRSIALQHTYQTLYIIITSINLKFPLHPLPSKLTKSPQA